MNKSLLIIGSPFQLLCAISAICEYKVSDYKLVLLRTDRLDQMENIATLYNLSWEVEPKIELERFGVIGLINGALHPQNCDYEILIVGDVRAINNMMYGLSYGNQIKKIIIVDDGNIMLSYFAGTMIISFKNKIYWWLLTLITKLKGIKIELFSIYSPDSKKFNWKKNTLSLQKREMKPDKMVVLFVGTNSDAFCSYYGYSKEYFLSVLRAILSDLSKNKKHEIQYIAHGRENFMEIEDICNSLSIKYVRPKECIELYVLNNSICPIEAYGFGSSALYNLKQIFPEATVYNIKLFGNDKNKINEMASTCKAYNAIGIRDFKLGSLQNFSLNPEN